MTQDIDTLCEHTKIRLIAAALGHQQCTKTEAYLIPLPGTDRYIAVGAADQVRALLPAQALPGIDLDLDKLEALARAATEGPWIAEGKVVSEAIPGDMYPYMMGFQDEEGYCPFTLTHLREDAEYFAAIDPATILALIAQARAAQPAGAADTTASDAMKLWDSLPDAKMPEAHATLAPVAAQQAAAVNIGGCPLCGRSNECASDCAAKAPAAQADYTVDDSELARKIMVFLGRATTASMEPGADPLRDRLAERIALWRPAATPASTLEASQQAAAEFIYQYRKKAAGDWKALYVTSDEEASIWVATEPGAEWRKVTDIGNDRQAAAVAAPVDLSGSGLLKLWRQAEEQATGTQPAPFQFARLLLSTPAAAATTSEDARDAALEEAAQLCEQWNTTPGARLAKEIRAMRATQKEGE